MMALIIHFIPCCM